MARGFPLAFALFFSSSLADATPAGAVELCSDHAAVRKATEQSGSDSCWLRFFDHDRRVLQIEVSKHTLEGIISIAGERDEYVPKVLQPILDRVTKDHGPNAGVVFFFDYFPPDQNENLDCHFYLRTAPETPDTNQPVGLIAEHCEDMAAQFKRAFERQLDERHGFVSGGVEKLILSGHEDPQVADRFKAAAPSNKVLIEALFPGPVDAYWSDAGFAVASFGFPVDGPVSVESDSSLRDLALKYTGSEENWPALWELNPQEIADPMFVKQGTKLWLPAMPTSWTPFLRTDDAFAEMVFSATEKIYGDKSYEAFVAWMIERAYGGKPPEILYLPTFGATQQLAPAKAIWRPE